MKIILGVLAALLLASCGGAGPDASYSQTKKYNANEDFLIAIGSPWYIFSKGLQSKPLDYPEEKWEPLSEEERVMVHLEYYTPANVQKILDRVKTYLAKAQNELSPPEYEKLIPQTNFDKTGDSKFSKVEFSRDSSGGYNTNFNYDKAMTLYYSGFSYIEIPIPYDLYGDLLIKVYEPLEYSETRKPYAVDYANFTTDKSHIVIGKGVGPEDRANYPLDEILAITEKVEAYWKQASSYKTYEKHLQSLKSDPENPIVNVMKSFWIRQNAQARLEKWISPKNRDAFKSKLEAFMTAWGI